MKRKQKLKEEAEKLLAYRKAQEESRELESPVESQISSFNTSTTAASSSSSSSSTSSSSTTTTATVATSSKTTSGNDTTGDVSPQKGKPLTEHDVYSAVMATVNMSSDDLTGEKPDREVSQEEKDELLKDVEV